MTISIDQPAAFGPKDVHAWRTRCGLSQTAAARALGITRVHFIFMEVGHRYDALRSPVRVTMTMRLAMAAVAKDLPPCGEPKRKRNRWAKVKLRPRAATALAAVADTPPAP